MGQPIKVLIADDHAVVRAGLLRILGGLPDIEVVGEAADGLEAVKKVSQLKPDVVLMDIFMPRCSGLDATVLIRQKCEYARVLILTISEREEDLLQALRLGAQGYLLKTSGAAEVVEAVRAIAAGEAMLSPQIITRLVSEFREKSNDPELSTREREVLKMLGEGLTNTDIARHLIIGESTVRTYIRRLLDKLHLKNRAEAIVYAARHSGIRV